jgi:hypothetical protein
MIIINPKIKNYLLESFKSGKVDKTKVTRDLMTNFDELKDQKFEEVRQLVVGYYNKEFQKHENPALAEACEERGVDINSVGIAWKKDKEWSIQFKPTKINVSFEDMMRDHLELIKEHNFEYEPIVRKPLKHPHLLVIDPADVHIGKLASSFETGEEYNNQIAVQRVKDGVEGILNKASGFEIDKILFVAGNDILHIDTPKRTTTSGTPQDTDDMWYNNFLIAKKLYIHVIDTLLKVADVHFVFNPSNHDYQSGFFLADSISSWYSNNKNITFDTSIAHRKYFSYFNNLIGTTHGDGAKPQDLPLLMAQEAQKEWSKCKHRYVYIHHIHHKTSKDYIGVTVEALRSPSGTDSWHHRNGYQHAPKAVEGFVHSKEHGQIARFTHLF